jgi:hypothetical protein
MNMDKPEDQPDNTFVNYAACDIRMFRTTFCCKRGLLTAHLGLRKALLKGPVSTKTMTATYKIIQINNYQGEHK